MTASALYFTGPRTVERRPVSVGRPAADEVLVETRLSAVSAGTELLVYRDEAPERMAADETIDSLDGDLSYPLRYGYAAVGDVVAVGSDVDGGWEGRTVFAFHPHQTRFCARPASLVALPPDLPPERAALLPTVETATNFALDAQPRVGERAVVFGAGVVGLCTVRLLAAFPLERLVAVDPVESRRAVAREVGADAAVAPGEVSEALDGGSGGQDGVSDTPGDVADAPDGDAKAPQGDAKAPDGANADLAIEVSGRPGTLDDAIDAVGFDGRVVVGSWYGDKRAAVDLGGRFHRDRIDLVSSQVSTIAPALRGRWSRDRRRAVAERWLERVDADALVTHRVPFGAAGEAYRILDERPDDALQVLLTYD